MLVLSTASSDTYSFIDIIVYVCLEVKDWGCVSFHNRLTVQGRLGFFASRVFFKLCNCKII